jgi:hypothetical protein
MMRPLRQSTGERCEFSFGLYKNLLGRPLWRIPETRSPMHELKVLEAEIL